MASFFLQGGLLVWEWTQCDGLKVELMSDVRPRSTVHAWVHYSLATRVGYLDVGEDMA